MELEDLRRIAANTEMSLNYIAKDEMLSKALLALQEFNNLILKGGTAIQRVYLKNKRFSEDLDFDFICKGSMKEALKASKELIKNLSTFTIEKPRMMGNTIRYDLFYTNPLNQKDRIMLEFNQVKSAQHYSKKIVNFGFVPYESSLLKVYDIEELILQKITCILERQEGKDFFDLYYLLSYPHKHRDLKDKKELLLKRIPQDKATINLIANSTNHYIPKSSRPQWDIFLEELKAKLRKY